MDNQFQFGTYGYIAKKNLRSAEKNLNLDADFVLYGSQQAIEKMLKHYIQLTYFKPDVKDILHTHKLHILLNKSGIVELQQYKSEIIDLSNYYFDGRYPGIGYQDIDMSDACDLFEAAKNIVAIIEKKIYDIENLKVKSESTTQELVNKLNIFDK